MTPRLIAGAALAVLLLGSAVQSAEPLTSGPQAGAKNDRRGFRPSIVAGAGAGQSLCPV